MRKIALIAVAALFAAAGAVPPAYAALSDRDGTVLRVGDVVQVAARGGNKGGRNEGGRNARDGRKGDRKGRVIWRVRNKDYQQYFLFRGRGDCRTETVKIRDIAGNLVVRNARVCN